MFLVQKKNREGKEHIYSESSSGQDFSFCSWEIMAGRSASHGRRIVHRKACALRAFEGVWRGQERVVERHIGCSNGHYGSIAPM
jgi:hypothetical protein